MEDRKCHQFKKGLHSTVKRLIICNRIGKLFDIVERTRSLDILRGTQRGVKVWEPCQPAVSLSSSLESYWSQGRKRQMEAYQSPMSQQSFRASTSFKVRRNSSRPPLQEETS